MSPIFTLGVIFIFAALLVMAPAALLGKNKMITAAFYEGFKVCVWSGLVLMAIPLIMVSVGIVHGAPAAH